MAIGQQLTKNNTIVFQTLLITARKTSLIKVIRMLVLKKMGRQKEFTGTAFPHFRIVFHSLLKYRPGWLYIRKEWTVRTSGSLPILLVHPIRIATL